jgi:hypothetical protein
VDAEKVPAIENVLATMRSLLEDLDNASYPLAAAYVSQAISVVEAQASDGRDSRD